MASVTRLYSANFGLHPYSFRKKQFYPLPKLDLQPEKVDKFFFHMLIISTETNLVKFKIIS